MYCSNVSVLDMRPMLVPMLIRLGDLVTSKLGKGLQKEYAK